MGFNAASEEYEDLIKAGVIDPTKVVRTALQNAASVSSLLLTTEAMVADKPEPKEDARARRRNAGRNAGHDVGVSPARPAKRSEIESPGASAPGLFSFWVPRGGAPAGPASRRRSGVPKPIVPRGDACRACGVRELPT